MINDNVTMTGYEQTLEALRLLFNEAGKAEGDPRVNIAQLVEWERAVAHHLTFCQLRIGELEGMVNRHDQILRASVPERHKHTASPVAAVQNYIAELEQRLSDEVQR